MIHLELQVVWIYSFSTLPLIASISCLILTFLLTTKKDKAVFFPFVLVEEKETLFKFHSHPKKRHLNNMEWNQQHMLLFLFLLWCWCFFTPSDIQSPLLVLWAQGVKIPLQIFWERAAYRQLTSVASIASAKNPKQQHQQSWSSEIDLTLNIFLPSSNVDGVVVADSVADFGFPFKQCTLKFENFKMQEEEKKLGSKNVWL